MVLYSASIDGGSMNVVPITNIDVIPTEVMSQLLSGIVKLNDEYALHISFKPPAVINRGNIQIEGNFELVRIEETATVKDEIDEKKRIIQCPYCLRKGPFSIQNDVEHMWYILGCEHCKFEIFKFESH
jgi:hypothetical protein